MARWKEKKEREKQKNQDRERVKCDAELRSQREEEEKSRQEEQMLDRLLPGPWRTLYEFLHGYPEMTQSAVILTAVTFERDVSDIPTICPGGFDLILQFVYYNLGGEGNCRKEFTELLGYHVKFPKDYMSMRVDS